MTRHTQLKHIMVNSERIRTAYYREPAECPMCGTEFESWREFVFIESDAGYAYSCPECKGRLFIYEECEDLGRFCPNNEGAIIQAVVCRKEGEPIYRYVPPKHKDVAWFVYATTNGDIRAYKGLNQPWEIVEQMQYRTKGDRPQVNILRNAFHAANKSGRLRGDDVVEVRISRRVYREIGKLHGVKGDTRDQCIERILEDHIQSEEFARTKTQTVR